jgi:hypothetical protein
MPSSHSNSERATSARGDQRGEVDPQPMALPRQGKAAATALGPPGCRARLAVLYPPQSLPTVPH